MKFKSTNLLGILILAYCVWNAKDLIQSWFQISLYEHYSWIILAVWLLPWLYFWLIAARSGERVINSTLLGAALLLSLLGRIGALHLLSYIGLALALAAFVPWSVSTFIWLVCSITWMPVSGWAASHLALNYIRYLFVVRLVIAAAASFWLISWERSKFKKE